MKKDIVIVKLFLRKKIKSIRKKHGCKFIIINISNAKNGYDLDYEVGNVQAFIGGFKNKKIKKLEKQLIKEKGMTEKLEKEMKVESRNKRIKRQKLKIKKIIKQLSH